MPIFSGYRALAKRPANKHVLWTCSHIRDFLAHADAPGTLRRPRGREVPVGNPVTREKLAHPPTQPALKSHLYIVQLFLARLPPGPYSLPLLAFPVLAPRQAGHHLLPRPRQLVPRWKQARDGGASRSPSYRDK